MRNRFTIVAITILNAILAAFILRDYLSQKLFIPLINLAHFFLIIIESLPQIFWWALLVLGLAIFIFRNMKISAVKKREKAIVNTNTLGLVTDWNRMIEQAKKGNYSRWVLMIRTVDLLIGILAYQHRLSKDQIKEMIISDEIKLPQEIRAFLYRGIHSTSFQHFLENEPKHRQDDIEMDIGNILDYFETDIS